MSSLMALAPMTTTSSSSLSLRLNVLVKLSEDIPHNIIPYMTIKNVSVFILIYLIEDHVRRFDFNFLPFTFRAIPYHPDMCNKT